MRTKILAATALSLLVAFTLGACGSSKSASDNTTSTSEAESPIGDRPENKEFCQTFAEQMQSIAPQVSQMQQGTGSQNATQQVADVFSEMATDAPTEIQPQFETAASSLDAIASGTQQSSTSADLQTSLTNISTFMTEKCPGVNVDLSVLAGIGGSTSSGATTTTKSH